MEIEDHCHYESWKRKRGSYSQKMVFRPQPSKYMKLRSECADFRKRVSNWITDLNCCKDLALMDGRACGWQVDASKFIKRLSEEFAEYMDLIQPVQVAVYEMKFGLSIAVSSALERKYSKETNESDIEKILGKTLFGRIKNKRTNRTKEKIKGHSNTALSACRHPNESSPAKTKPKEDLAEASQGPHRENKLIELFKATVYSFMLFPSGSVAESAHVNQALLNKLVTVSTGMTSSEVVCSPSVAQLDGSLNQMVHIVKLKVLHQYHIP